MEEHSSDAGDIGKIADEIPKEYLVPGIDGPDVDIRNVVGYLREVVSNMDKRGLNHTPDIRRY